MTGQTMHSTLFRVRKRHALGGRDGEQCHDPRADGPAASRCISRAATNVICKRAPSISIPMNARHGRVPWRPATTSSYLSIPRAFLASAGTSLERAVCAKSRAESPPQWRLLLRYAQSRTRNWRSCRPRRSRPVSSHVHDLTLSWRWGASREAEERKSPRGGGVRAAGSRRSRPNEATRSPLLTSDLDRQAPRHLAPLCPFAFRRRGDSFRELSPCGACFSCIGGGATPPSDVPASARSRFPRASVTCPGSTPASGVPSARRRRDVRAVALAAAYFGRTDGCGRLPLTPHPLPPPQEQRRIEVPNLASHSDSGTPEAPAPSRRHRCF